jgi:hypothetical protein
VRERIDLCVLIFTTVNATETGEGILAIDVHGTRATDTLSTRATKSECRIYFILDLDERVKNLKAGGVSRSDEAHRGKVLTIGPHSFKSRV